MDYELRSIEVSSIGDENKAKAIELNLLRRRIDRERGDVITALVLEQVCLYRQPDWLLADDFDISRDSK